MDKYKRSNMYSTEMVMWEPAITLSKNHNNIKKYELD